MFILQINILIILENKMKENKFNKTFDKKEIKFLANWFLINYGSIKTLKLLEKLKLIGFKYSTLAGISLGIEDLKIPPAKKSIFKYAEKEIEKNENRYEKGKINIVDYTERTIKIWTSVNDILKNEVVDNFRQTNVLNPLYMMASSGARGNISQIRQLVGMRGLMSDSKGELINVPIKDNFKEGLTLTEYFISCYGARKGLIDTALKTANSGYLTRRLVYVAQSQTITQVSCQTKYKNLIVTSQPKNKSEFIIKKEYLVGRVLAKEIIDKFTNQRIASFGQDICNYLAKRIIKENKIFILSPLTCKLNRGICQLCYGWNLGNGRMAELGESVGVIAAQSIGEPGTQLTMRTFHTGGVFTGEVKKSLTAPHTGRIFYKTNEGVKRIQTTYNEKVFITTNEKKIVIYKDSIQKSIITLPPNSIIFPKSKEKIYQKQIIAEFLEKDPKERSEIGEKNEIQEVKASFSGQLYYEKNKKKKENKKSICVLSGNILSFKKVHSNLNKRKIYKKKEENLEPRYFEDNKKIYRLRLNFSRIKLFQRKILKKENYIIQKIFSDTKEILIKKIKTEKILKNKYKKIKVGKFLNKNRRLNRNFRNLYPSQIIEKNTENIIVRKIRPYKINSKLRINLENLNVIKKNNTLFYLNYKKKKTEDIVQGLPKVEELLEAKKTANLESIRNNPHDILRESFRKLMENYTNTVAARKSIEKIQKYLILKVQNVYRSQGVNISDKHLEVIVKQMTSKVIINKPGNSNLIIGEIIEINKVEKMNKDYIKGEKITYEPLILGLSKISLSNQSFISQASFQETTRVLTKSAIEGKIDWLIGLKENLILGNLIPAGTGYSTKR